MNAALCVATENHGSRQLGAEALAAADVHLSVPPVRALPMLRGDRPHDRLRLSVWRGLSSFLWPKNLPVCVGCLCCVQVSSVKPDLVVKTAYFKSKTCQSKLKMCYRSIREAVL